MTFAGQIKTTRERLGLTQAAAAALLDVSKSVIEKWESGTRTPLEITQEGALARLSEEKSTNRTIFKVSPPGPMRMPDGSICTVDECASVEVSIATSDYPDDVKAKMEKMGIKTFLQNQYFLDGKIVWPLTRENHGK